MSAPEISHASPKKRRGPGWRKFTWAILVINVLFLIWVISAGASSSGTAKDCGSLSQQTCEDAQDVGAGIAVVLLIVFWAVVDVILGVLWLVTKPRGRDCPACGNTVKRGQMQCKECGYDFRALVTPPAPVAP